MDQVRNILWWCLQPLQYSGFLDCFLGLRKRNRSETKPVREGNKLERFSERKAFSENMDSIDCVDIPSTDYEVGEFTVPKLYSPTKMSLYSEPGTSTSNYDVLDGGIPRTRPFSMFRKPDQSEFNRDLYDLRQDSEVGAEGRIILGPHGSLNVGLSFDLELSILRVQLIQATDIRAKRTDALPSPYFKVKICGASTNFDGFQTKVNHETRNPTIDDDFCFDVSKEQLPACRLEVLMYDYDQFALDECIGMCSLALGRVELPTDGTFNVFWAEILPSPDEDQQDGADSAGDILFRISYLKSAHRLTVTVLKARNLTGPDDQQPPSPCVRVTLFSKGRRIKRCRTSAKAASYHPTFNEALNFSVQSKFVVCDLTLEFEVVHDTLLHKKPLGRLVLPLSQCKELWKSFVSGDNIVPKWYPLEKP